MHGGVFMNFTRTLLSHMGENMQNKGYLYTFIFVLTGAFVPYERAQCVDLGGLLDAGV